MSVHKTPDGRWFVAYREPGKKSPSREYFGRGDLGKMRANQRNDEIKRNRGKEDLVDAITLAAMCDLYHNQHAVESTTQRNDFYKFRVILPHLGTVHAESLTTHHLNDYVTERCKTVKKSTVKREITLLKAAYSWAEYQDPPLILRNPIAKFRLKDAGARDVPLPPTQTEIQKILSHAAPHLRRAILLQWYMGLRPGPREALGILWRDVDLHNGVIRVVGARKGGPAVRYVPIAQDLLPDIERWLEADTKELKNKVWDVCIINHNGKCVGSMKRAWREAKVRAKITRKLRLYDLRHAFVSDILKDGGDLRTVSEIIGHSRPDTTLREYQHVTKDQHRGIVDKRKSLLREVE